jgi:hypothetical protein
MAEAKLVLTDALIAEALKRGKQSEPASGEAGNDNRPDDAQPDFQPRDARRKPAGPFRHRNRFQRAPGENRNRAQHEGD